jgi:GT2 family glycosyltransferase
MRHFPDVVDAKSTRAGTPAGIDPFFHADGRLLFDESGRAGLARASFPDGATDIRWFVRQVLIGTRKPKNLHLLLKYFKNAVLGGTSRTARSGGRPRLAARPYGQPVKLDWIARLILARHWSVQFQITPPPDFHEHDYVAENPDVADAIRRGEFSCGFAHYVKCGIREGRSRPDFFRKPAPSHESAQSSLVERIATMFGHAAADRIAGYFEQYELALPPEARSAPDRDRSAGWLSEMKGLASERLADEPDVTVVIPVYNNLQHTMACIHSLLELETRVPFEIIVSDDASTDATPAVFEDNAAGIGYVRNERNRGFIATANAGAALARGRYVAFLNNDTIVLPSWLDELVDTLERDPNIGLVGSRMLSADGLLQEAGGIVWRDGSAWNYGRGEDPLHPGFNYMRDVDYVSGASIMLPRTIWKELGGFDDLYEVAYGEDSDLAFRVRAHGKRVVYQPLSTIVHFEGATSGTDVSTGAKSYQARNAKKLYARWRHVLKTHRDSGENVILERERGVKKRVLVVDACTPAPDEDAGSLTCFELMRAFQANGFKVSFMPQSNFLYMPKETGALQRLGIEALYHPYYASQEAYLKEFGRLFDAVLLFRHESAFALLPRIRECAPQAKVMFHVSDLHFIRERRKSELEGVLNSGGRLTQAREMYCVHGSDLTIVHSEYERDVLSRYAPESSVYVFPWILDTQPSSVSFNGRRDIAFLGGYAHPPNVDAVLYFADEIWPRIHAREPEMRFHIVGSRCPDELRLLHGKRNINVVGYVEDLSQCFGQIRLSVAPLRYGAGIKGKVAMAMSCGVPVVATSCGAEGMALRDGENILVRDDAASFADAVVRAYRDEALWNRMSSGALDFIARGYSTERGIARVAEMVDAVSGAAAQADREAVGP